MGPDIALTLHLDRPLYDLLVEISRRSGRSLNEIFRMAVEKLREARNLRNMGHLGLVADPRQLDWQISYRPLF